MKFFLCSAILLNAGAARRGELRAGAADIAKRGLRRGGGLLGEHDLPRARGRPDVLQCRGGPHRARCRPVAAQHPHRQPRRRHVALQQVSVDPHGLRRVESISAMDDK